MFLALARNLCLVLLLFVVGTAGAAEPRLKKTKQYFLDATKESPLEPGQDRYVEFERKRALYGAVTPSDQRERYGNYFTFFWEAPERADVLVRLEYRQQNLGPVVQSKTLTYREAVGIQTSRFSIIGDDYLQYGRVLAWRVTLIRAGKVVDQRRSYLWRDK